MDERIKEKLDKYHLLPEDLTQDEMDALKEEVEFERGGGMILDGVLSGYRLVEIEERKFNRIYGKERNGAARGEKRVEQRQ